MNTPIRRPSESVTGTVHRRRSAQSRATSSASSVATADTGSRMISETRASSGWVTRTETSTTPVRRACGLTTGTETMAACSRPPWSRRFSRATATVQSSRRRTGAMRSRRPTESAG